jgi:hypothetical protein
MTIESTASEISYSGNGATLAFAVPFPFDTSADLKVLSTDTTTGLASVLSSGFVVTGGGGTTGTVTFTVAPATGKTITILDDPARTQPTDYVSNDAFPAESHEDALDRVTRLCKRLYQLSLRALHLPDGDATTDASIATVQTRKGKYLYFDATTGAIDYATAIATTTLSQGTIGALLYPRTAAEISAGVTPTNYAYPPLYLLRYGTNTTPGTTDMLTALNSLVSVAKQMTAPKIVIPDGVYYVSGMVTFDLPNYSTIEWNGQVVTGLSAATCIRLGSSSTNITGMVVTGHGVHVSRSSIDYAGSSVGVEPINLVVADVKIHYVSGFSAGIYARGTQANGGLSYCKFHLGQIWDSKICLNVSASGSGYANENNFYGGTFNFSSAYASAAGSYAGTYCIYEDYFASSPLNGNKFWGPSLESGGTATVAFLCHGVGTHIYAPRLEVGSGAATDFKINFTSNSSYCLLLMAVGGNMGSVTDSGVNNSVFSNNGFMIKGNATGGEGVIRAQAYSADTMVLYEGRNTSGVKTFSVDGSGLGTFGAAIKGKRVVVTYSASITPDANLATCFDISPNNGTAFTINLPTNPTDGQVITYTIRNTSGGALGAITWDSAYKMSAWTNPANAFSRSITFRYNGAAWVQISQTGVDVPN